MAEKQLTKQGPRSGPVQWTGKDANNSPPSSPGVTERRAREAEADSSKRDSASDSERPGSTGTPLSTTTSGQTGYLKPGGRGSEGVTTGHLQIDVSGGALFTPEQGRKAPLSPRLSGRGRPGSAFAGLSPQGAGNGGAGSPHASGSPHGMALGAVDAPMSGGSFLATPPSPKLLRGGSMRMLRDNSGANTSTTNVTDPATLIHVTSAHASEGTGGGFDEVPKIGVSFDPHTDFHQKPPPQPQAARATAPPTNNHLSTSPTTHTNPLNSRRLTQRAEEQDTQALHSKLRAIFSEIDVNGDGDINLEEIPRMLLKLGFECTETEAMEFLREVDDDGSGAIGFEEFVKFYKHMEFVVRGVQNQEDGGDTTLVSEPTVVVAQTAVRAVVGKLDTSGNTASSDEFAPRNLAEPQKMRGLLELVRQQREADKDAYMTDKKKQARQRIYELMHDLPSFAPDYVYRRWWDVVVLILAIFHWVCAPVQSLFGVEPATELIAVEIVVSFFLLLDMFVQLNTAVQREDRAFELISDRKLIGEMYVRSGYAFVDFFAGFPFDIIVWLACESMIGWRICRGFRILKMIKVPTLFKMADRGNMDPSFVQFYFWTVPIVKLLSKMVVIGSAMTVGRMLLATYSVDFTSGDCEGKQYGLDTCEPSFVFRYLYSAWWCWALLTTQGLANIENGGVYTYAAFVMCMSLLLQGHVIATMSALFIKSDVAEQNSDSMRETLAIMRQYGIPSTLQQEVLSFQYHSLQQNAAAGFGHVLQRLPGPMQNEVGLYIRVDLIAKVPWFEDLSVDCKLELANCLEQTYCEPDCFIIEYNEQGREMFFMMHGFADVIVPDEASPPDETGNPTYGKVLATVKRGDFFGEMALLDPNLRRTASIQALSYCDMFQLHSADFNKLLTLYDELRLRVEAEARKRGLERNQPSTKIDMALLDHFEHGQEKFVLGRSRHSSLASSKQSSNAGGSRRGRRVTLHPTPDDADERAHGGTTPRRGSTARRHSAAAATESFRRTREEVRRVREAMDALEDVKGESRRSSTSETLVHKMDSVLSSVYSASHANVGAHGDGGVAISRTSSAHTQPAASTDTVTTYTAEGGKTMSSAASRPTLAGKGKTSSRNWRDLERIRVDDDTDDDDEGNTASNKASGVLSVQTIGTKSRGSPEAGPSGSPGRADSPHSPLLCFEPLEVNTNESSSQGTPVAGLKGMAGGSFKNAGRSYPVTTRMDMGAKDVYSEGSDEEPTQTVRHDAASIVVMNRLQRLEMHFEESRRDNLKMLRLLQSIENSMRSLGGSLGPQSQTVMPSVGGLPNRTHANHAFGEASCAPLYSTQREPVGFRTSSFTKKRL